MNFFTSFSVSILILTLLAPNSRAAEWESDLDIALERAATENRDVLFIFRGPSSNPICRQMNEEVLDGIEFRTVLGTEYVLCNALALEDSEDSDVVRKGYRELSRRLHVAAYPILVLLDSEERVFAQTSIPKSTAADLVRTVEAMRPRRALLDDLVKAAIDAQNGSAEHAKALSQALVSFDTEFSMTHYPELVAKVKALDAQDQQGLKTFWNQQETAKAVRNFNQIFASIAPELWSKKASGEMVELLDSTIKKHSMKGEALQMMEIQIYRAWAKEQNYEKMLEALRHAYSRGSESRIGQRISAFIQQTEQQLAKQAADAKAENAGDIDPAANSATAPVPGENQTPEPELKPEPEPKESVDPEK